MLEGNLYTVLSRSANEARVRFLPGSPIYAAHFPEYPITPGVCLVQMALELMGRSLLGAKDIKFVQPVLPGAELRAEWNVQEGRADVNLFLEPDGGLCAKMSLSV